jgi:hypothetical protein
VLLQHDLGAARTLAGQVYRPVLAVRVGVDQRRHLVQHVADASGDGVHLRGHRATLLLGLLRKELLRPSGRRSQRRRAHNLLFLLDRASRLGTHHTRR